MTMTTKKTFKTDIACINCGVFSKKRGPILDGSAPVGWLWARKGNKSGVLCPACSRPTLARHLAAGGKSHTFKVTA